MRKALKISLSILFCLIFVCSAVTVSAEHTAKAELGTVRDSILSYEIQKNGNADLKDWIANTLPLDIGGAAEWYILALAQTGEYDFSAYAEALHAHVNENKISNAVTRQKYALALLASGYTSDFVQQSANECAGKLGIMSDVWAMHLAENGFVPEGTTKETLLDRLLARELADGGFAVTGNVFQPDVSAMVLQALAPHRDTQKVRAVIDRTLSLLSDAQTANGSFSLYGTENAESCAQVIITMAMLKIAPDDPRFVKNGNSVLDALLSYRCENGGFSHTVGEDANASATAQAYLALSALQNGSFYNLKNLDSLIPLTYKEKEPAENEEPLSWRIYALAAIGILTATACILLTVFKKRHYKNYLLVLLAAAALVLLVFTIDLQSADDYYGAQTEPKENIIGTVTIEIRCDTVKDRADLSYIPADGVILKETSLPLAEGETVFDILLEAARTHRIHTEHQGSGAMVYIKGIGYLYELDHGDLSGWIYHVNGESSSVGCGAYTLSDGDRIVWHYTLQQGTDIPTGN